jgi:hypothetical protein
MAFFVCFLICLSFIMCLHDIEGAIEDFDFHLYLMIEDFKKIM